MSLQRTYANTHTEDDVTGRSMTRLLHEAERSIKRAVNAGPSGRIIACGTGATAAIDKMQQILGVALCPATRQNMYALLERHAGTEQVEAFRAYVREQQPVAFVGPYEHHSNEVTWREGLATVVEVQLSGDGCVDLQHLESLLQDPRYQGRLRIGSFSAASNVTGMTSPVHDIARLLHKYGAFACFDFAASGPYVPIDMNPSPDPDGGDASLDAVFLSPHKFLGGPGSCGVLVFNERLYPKELPPTVAGGGTVDYVGYSQHDFTTDIEEREKAGTPGVLQLLKAALAFQVKEAAGTDAIHARERTLVTRAMETWREHPGIEMLGNPDPDRRVAIVSFNLKDVRGQYLHPKFVTTLANDLFGIQSRAGCSCAGPYGHRLLHIDEPTSERYRRWIQKGYQGIKPGWCRIGFHYVMDDAEADYVIRALLFLADEGVRFLPLYRFDDRTGGWIHRDDVDTDSRFSLASALRVAPVVRTALSEEERRRRYRVNLDAARTLAATLAAAGDPDASRLEGEMGELQYFRLPGACRLAGKGS
jgi:selenocysteine lyase/cysteine desulfurase